MKGEEREPNSPSSASRPRAVMNAGDIAPAPGRTVRKNARRDNVMRSSLGTRSIGRDREQDCARQRKESPESSRRDVDPRNDVEGARMHSEYLPPEVTLN